MNTLLLQIVTGLAVCLVCGLAGVCIAAFARRAGIRAAEVHFGDALLLKEIQRVEHKLNNVRAISDAQDFRIQKLEGSNRES